MSSCPLEFFHWIPQGFPEGDFSSETGNAAYNTSIPSCAILHGPFNYIAATTLERQGSLYYFPSHWNEIPVN